MGIPKINSLPILFSGEMVCQILNGNKTQTRRVVKEPPENPVRYDGCGFEPENAAHHFWERLNDDGTPTEEYRSFGKCPYGVVGDKLWIRETWADVTNAFSDSDDIRSVAFKADNSVYDVYGQTVFLEHLGDSGIYVDKWKPSIFMPREASRLTLEITGIRVERLQEISLEDAEAEGVCVFAESRKFGDVAHFRDLWNSINFKRGFGWQKNPWVWIIEFIKL